MTRNSVSPYRRLMPRGDSITIPTNGKVLVLPTGSPTILPSFNEYVLNTNRCTIAETPFGGLKGSGSPDYGVGTVYCQTSGCVVTDVAGNNSGSTLSAGKLKELGYLSVDLVGHSVTEEFIVSNTSTSNNPSTLIAGNDTSGWSFAGSGSGSVTTDGTNLTASGTSNASGVFRCFKTISVDIGTAKFVKFTITPSNDSVLSLIISSTDASSNFAYFNSVTRFLLAANTPKTFVLPIFAPAGTTGQNPDSINGTITSTIRYIRIGLAGVPISSAVSFVLSAITVDVAKSCYLELATPDNLADTSADIQVYSGSSYSSARVAKLDSTFSSVAVTTANFKMLDGTTFDDVYGSGNGRSLFAKGIRGQVQTSGSLAGSQITYSSNYGTSRRIGLRIDLPPSDSGRTTFNQVRLKVITYYSDLNKATDTLLDISGNGNNGTMQQIGLTYDSFGNPYKAMKFDGVSTCNVSIPDASVLRLTSGGTIGCWIYPISLGGSNTGRILDKSTGVSGTNGYTFIMYTNNSLALLINNAGTGTFSSNNSISLNTWQYVLVEFDNTGRKLYVNLVDVTNTGGSETGLPPDVSGNITIGNKTTTLDRSFNGYIKDVTIFNRKLSSDEKTACKAGNPPSPGLIYRGNPKTVSHMGATSYEFENSSNTSYGLQNLGNYPSTIIDKSGNGNTGTPTAIAFDQGAMLFNGSSSYVSVADASALRLTSGGTIGCWIYPIGYGGNNGGRIIDKSTSVPAVNGYLLAVGSNNSILQFYVNNGTPTYSTYNSIVLYTWQYALIEFDNTGRKLYVNLVDVTSTGGTETGLPPDVSGEVRIGNRAGNTDRGFNGYIKDLTIYSRKLSANEKTACMNGNPPSSGLIGRWDAPKSVSPAWVALLDAPRTDILPDASQYKNDGVMSNVTLAADASGNPYGAMSFNGSSSYVDCGNPVSLNITSAITICTRFYITDLTANRRIIGGSLTFGASYVLYARSAGNLAWSINNGATQKSIVQGSITSGNWIDVVAIWDGINIPYIFINGTKFAPGSTGDQSIARNHTGVTIGKSDSSVPYFNGSIKEVLIYNRVISDSDATAYHNNQAIDNTGLVASWKPYQPSSQADFFLFTNRPKSLIRRRDEQGIYELQLYPGNGSIYQGRVQYPDLQKVWNATPGLLSTPTTGAQLTDISGNNAGSSLTGTQANMVVDTIAQTITEEFILQNTNTANSATVIDDCSATTGWGVMDGTGTITSTNGHLVYAGNANVGGAHRISKAFSITSNTKPFICFGIKNSQACNLHFTLWSGGSDYTYFSGSRFPIAANTLTYFVLPLNAPAGTTGQNPGTRTASYSISTVTAIYLGVTGIAGSSANTIEIYPITYDAGLSAYLEAQIPDNLATQTYITNGAKPCFLMQCWNGSAYGTGSSAAICAPSTTDTYYVSGTNTMFLDGTTLGDTYGTYVAASFSAVYDIGGVQETKAEISQAAASVPSTFTYSNNPGTLKRIGFVIYMPPSDSGRTTFNKVRLKLVINYAPLPVLLNSLETGSINKLLQNKGMLI